MADTLWFDCETYSQCDLKKAGTHAYAEHQSTEITVAQFALNDEDPTVIDMTHPERDMLPELRLVKLLQDPSILKIAHNSMFDRTLLRHVWKLDIPAEQWLDTMVMALSVSLPGGLDKLSTIFGLEANEAKDKRGRDLIQMFCKPAPKSKLRDGVETVYRKDRNTHPKEWAEFLEYSRQDIIAMRAIHRRIPAWNMAPGSPEHRLWHLDQCINDRGFAVDTDLVRGAVDAVAEEQRRLARSVMDATDGSVASASKVDQLLAHILMEYGVSLPDMAADTLRRRIEDPDLPAEVKQLISLRLESAKSSTAKYTALARATSEDGRLRNTLQFCGAPRTARWAGRIFQPQNLPRPSETHIASFFRLKRLPKDDTPDGAAEKHALILAYEQAGVSALKGGAAAMMFDDVMQLTTNLVRGVIVAPESKKLCVADLSNIEGRGLAHLAGEEWKIQAFRDADAGKGSDLYKLAYARSFGVDPKDVDKGQRQIGKVQELGLGYEGGVAAFVTFAEVYRMDLGELAKAVRASADRDAWAAASGVYAWAERKGRTLGLPQEVYTACEVLKSAWRQAHPATVALWAGVANAVRAAIAEPETALTVGRLAIRRDGAWLRVRLPSGRYLCYLKPEVEPGGQITYLGVNAYTRKWSRLKTYGGKLVENITQAWARDVLASSLPAIEAAGYPIVLTVHDEVLTEVPDTPEFSHEDLARMMSTQPAWAADCPLAAAGFTTYRYRKD